MLPWTHSIVVMNCSTIYTLFMEREEPETPFEALLVLIFLFDNLRTVSSIFWCTAALAPSGNPRVLQTPYPLCPFLSFSSQALLAAACTPESFKPTKRQEFPLLDCICCTLDIAHRTERCDNCDRYPLKQRKIPTVEPPTLPLFPLLTSSSQTSSQPCSHLHEAHAFQDF